MAYVHCIHCAREVRPRQHAIACDVCGLWQHRTCNTGISLLAYREAANNRGEISFTCRPCRELNQQVPLTIAVSDEDQDEPVDPPFLELSRDKVNSTLWRCTYRSVSVKCPVTIRQQGNLFVQKAMLSTHTPLSLTVS